jgi:hypothetical protein
VLDVSQAFAIKAGPESNPFSKLSSSLTAYRVHRIVSSQIFTNMFRATALVTLLSAAAVLANPIMLNTTSRDVQLEKRFDDAQFTFYDVGL